MPGISCSQLSPRNHFQFRVDGPIPDLSSLVNLRVLWLNENRLTGSIPESLAQLTALEELYLYGNYLSGPIPPALGHIPRLNRLHLSRNHLSGNVPDSLGLATCMVLLEFSNNCLTGPLPASLGNLVNLEVSFTFSSPSFGHEFVSKHLCVVWASTAFDGQQ